MMLVSIFSVFMSAIAAGGSYDRALMQRQFQYAKELWANANRAQLVCVDGDMSSEANFLQTMTMVNPQEKSRSLFKKQKKLNAVFTPQVTYSSEIELDGLLGEYYNQINQAVNVMSQNCSYVAEFGTQGVSPILTIVNPNTPMKPQLALVNILMGLDFISVTNAGKSIVLRMTQSLPTHKIPQDFLKMEHYDTSKLARNIDIGGIYPKIIQRQAIYWEGVFNIGNCTNKFAVDIDYNDKIKSVSDLVSLESYQLPNFLSCELTSSYMTSKSLGLWNDVERTIVPVLNDVRLQLDEASATIGYSAFGKRFQSEALAFQPGSINLYKNHELEAFENKKEALIEEETRSLYNKYPNVDPKIIANVKKEQEYKSWYTPYDSIKNYVSRMVDDKQEELILSLKTKDADRIANQLLAILKGSIPLILQENENRLPTVVAYFNANRSQFDRQLKELKAELASEVYHPLEIIAIMRGLIKVYDDLDVAVGLKSNNEVRMKQLLRVD